MHSSPVLFYKEDDSGLLATWDSPGPGEARSLANLPGKLPHNEAASASAECITLRRVRLDNIQTCLTLKWAAL